jgi:hypothetical protein
MGLGKTLTMIALVATDLDRSSTDTTAVESDEETRPLVSATLIVIPPPRKEPSIRLTCKQFSILT